MQVTEAPSAGVDGVGPERVTGPAWAGVLSGLAAMAAGLATAELLSALLGGDGSVLVEVGNRVVDLVPSAVRKWAISTFGTSDKAVLLAGVAVVLGCLAAAAGVMFTSGRRRPAAALVAVALVIGSVAPLGRGGSGPRAVVAVLAGGAVAVGVLWWLGVRAAALGGTPTGGSATSSVPAAGAGAQGSPPARPDPAHGGAARAEPQAMPAPARGGDRRRFLGLVAGVGAASVAAGGVGAWLRSRGAVAAERLGVTLPRALRPLPPVSPGVSVGVEGVSSFITPNEEFYRIDTALVVPRVSTQGWSLRVHGMVDRELTLDYRELLDRPMIEVDCTIACVSNEVGGDLVGTARWLGCRLDDLLAEAGVDPRADQVVGRSTDGFTAGFPTAALDGRDAIVAVGMNGEALPAEHGYPARLIVPGLFGYVSATKWLAEVELTRFDAFEGYWIPRGWDVLAPVTTQSRIDTPRTGADVPSGEVVLGGVAWAPIRGVAAVEVRVDDGEWVPAELGERHADTTWRQWRATVELAEGERRVAVRAIDGDGGVQSGERAPAGPNAATGWHTIVLRAG